MQAKSSPLVFLKNPFVVLISIGIGIFIGFKYPVLAEVIAPIGEIYINLLKMAVIPILISAIISNVARLANSNMVGSLLSRVLVVFSVSVIFIAVFGVLLGYFSGVGSDLSQEQRDVLGNYVETSQISEELEISLSATTVSEEKDILVDFIVNIVPENIFQSLSLGNTINLVFFCIILGVAIGVIRDYSGETFINTMTACFLAFQNIINWIIYFLPIGLVCLIADQVKSTGIEIVKTMAGLILVFYIGAIVIIILNTFIIYLRSKKPLTTVISAVMDPVILAFSTRSSYATIPSSVECLEKKLYFERSITNLIIPLGITLLRYGNIFYFAVVTMFIAQLYDIDLGVTEFIVVIVGTIFAGMATAGATGFATIGFIAVALNPLGVPYEAIIVILYAIDTLLDPMRTTLIVHTNIMSTSLISKIYQGDRSLERN